MSKTQNPRTIIRRGQEYALPAEFGGAGKGQGRKPLGKHEIKLTVPGATFDQYSAVPRHKRSWIREVMRVSLAKALAVVIAENQKEE